MVTRAKSSATKLKLPSKKAGAKIMVKKMKSVVRKSTAGKAGQEEEKKGPVNVVRNLRRAVKNIKVPSKEEPLRAPVSDQERKKRPKKKFQYEMDCADVENIDIIDFVSFPCVDLFKFTTTFLHLFSAKLCSGKYESSQPKK